MRRLIVSDIHGNLEALEAVLNEAHGEYDEVVCCGDLVGYGASPREVVEWAMAHSAATVRGNHDRVCAGLDDDGWFNEAARRAVAWTRAQLPSDNLAWLRELPVGPLDLAGFELAHGSPDDEDDYLVDDYDVAHLDEILRQPVCFIGHTHLQRGWRWSGDELLRLDAPDLDAREVVIEIRPDSQYLINPGSVGQPRDKDRRAAYALWDDERGALVFRRVEYDVAAAQERIRAAGLPGWLADRLTSGR
jgi:diadenosine tetraphosphatase ApaH/serine/threonine PP2A family protein phosphatase